MSDNDNTNFTNGVPTDPLVETDKRARDKKIPVVEIFGPTMQGEGAVVGIRTVFIRFGLCDYKCVMCDSMHAVDPAQVKKNATWMTQAEIYDKLLPFMSKGNCEVVTYSGGNPCIHDLEALSTYCRAGGWDICVETQGTFCPSWLRLCKYITISPKGPGMGEKFEQKRFNDFIGILEVNQHPFSIKVVVFDNRDLEFASQLAMEYQWVMDKGAFFLSLGNPFPPGTDQAKDLPNTQLIACLTKHYETMFQEIKDYPLLARARFMPQGHVMLWGNKAGV